MLPEAYRGQVTSSHDRTTQWSVIEAATYYDLPPLIGRVGDWAISRRGLHCLTTRYDIASNRLGEDWQEHMSLKTWVNKVDMIAALDRIKALVACGYVDCDEDDEN
jgi:hypothetical protein